MIDKNDPKLTEFVLGELDSVESAEIAMQVEETPELKDAVEQIRQTIGLVEESYQSEPELSLNDEQKVELGQSEQSPVAVKAGRRLWWVLAASLLLMLGSGSFWMATRSEPKNDELLAQIQQLEKWQKNLEEALESESNKESGRQGDLEKALAMVTEAVSDVKADLRGHSFYSDMNENGLTEDDFESLVELISRHN